MILRAEHLVKKYKSRTVVKDVSVQVEQGEIVGLLGPNGAGKTTSFYMIVGLITPNGGRIFLDDQEITKEPVYKRAQFGVGYLAQEASVFRRLSVEDNIKAVMEMTSMTKEFAWKKCWMNLVYSTSVKVWESSFQVGNAAGPRLRGLCRSTRNLFCWTSLLPGLTPLQWRIFKALFKN